MPYALERWGDKAIVVNTMSGHHYSTSPITLPKAEAQMRVLKQAEKKEDDSSDPPGEKFIQEVVSSPSFKKGAFTAQAKAHGMETKEFMEEVLSHPEDYTLTTRRRAQFLHNILRK